MIILLGLKEHNTINIVQTFLIWFVQLHLQHFWKVLLICSKLNTINEITHPEGSST